MTYSAIKRKLDAGGVVILDGGTGTELQRRGAPMDPAAWCGPATLGNDALLTDIHADYIEAGAEVVTANTFAASRLMLKGAGLADKSGEITRRAVEAALRARERTKSGNRVAVAGSLSHMVPVAAGTAKVDPKQIASPAEQSDAFHEVADNLKKAGAELILLEMMYVPERIRRATEAALATGLPIWFGLSARRTGDGRVISFDWLTETPLDDVIACIPPQGIDAAGVMHTGAEIVGEALADLRKRFEGPLTAYPDSGYFEMPDWRFVDVIAPDRLQQFAEGWLRSGVQVVGGCCGLGPEHVRAVAKARDAVAAR